MGALLGIRTPAQVEQSRSAAQAQRLSNASAAPAAPSIERLAAHVRQAWESARNAAEKPQARMLDCLRRRQGQYEPRLLAEIRSYGGSEIYMQLTATKVRAAVAWLEDVFFQAGESVVSVEPTPIAELPPEFEQQLFGLAAEGVQQLGVSPEQAQALLEQHRARVKQEVQAEAERRAAAMAAKLADLLAEGGFRAAFAEFLQDFCTFPAAYFEGPVFAERWVMRWGKDAASGRTVPALAKQVVPLFAHIPSFDVFPLPNAKDPQSGGLCVRRRLSLAALSLLRGAPHYKAEAVEAAIADYGRGGLRSWLAQDYAREQLEGRYSWLQSSDHEIDALQYLGVIPGELLAEWGLQGIDPRQAYSAEVWLVGRHVLKAVLNPDPLQSKRVYKACFEALPGAWHGIALPERIADCADACNAASRALMDNLAVASGPQVVAEVDRLPEGYDLTHLYPWKIHQTTSSQNGGSRPGIDFFQPDMHASELLGVYERFARMADDQSGIPAYAYGSDDAAGAGRTARGLSMLMNATSKTLKSVVRAIDVELIEPLGNACITHLMLTDPDESIKGDCKARARGSDALLHKEAKAEQQREILATISNPLDAELVGLKGRAQVLREVVKSADMPADKIVPDEQALAEAEQAALQAQALPPAPVGA